MDPRHHIIYPNIKDTKFKCKFERNQEVLQVVHDYIHDKQMNNKEPSLKYEIACQSLEEMYELMSMLFAYQAAISLVNNSYNFIIFRIEPASETTFFLSATFSDSVHRSIAEGITRDKEK